MPEIATLIQALDDKLTATDEPIEMAKIYYDAGLLFEQNGETDEACFFMTQAYVFASQYGEKMLVESSGEFLRRYNRI